MYESMYTQVLDEAETTRLEYAAQAELMQTKMNAQNMEINELKVSIELQRQTISGLSAQFDAFMRLPAVVQYREQSALSASVDI